MARHCSTAKPKLKASMKVPPKRKGNLYMKGVLGPSEIASMKVPPKRKGNLSFMSRSAVAALPQ